MLVAGTTGKISSIYLGDRRISTVLLGEQMLFPFSERTLEEQIEDYIDASDVPQVDFEESPDEIRRNMLRKGNGLDKDPVDVPTVEFTEEQ